MGLPFVVWMMKGFFDEIPREFEEAAMIDGYSRLEAIWKIVIPEVIPPMLATAVFVLITLCGVTFGAVQGQVYVAEPLGNHNINNVQIGASLVRVKTAPTFMLDVATRVAVRFDMARAHLFDALTELALT